MADAGYLVPGGTEKEFLPVLAEIAAREGVDVILPLATYELWALAEARERLPVAVMVSGIESIRTANDKGRLYETLVKRGLRRYVPRFLRVTNFMEFEKAVERLGYPERPVCFKPPVSKGSRGFRILDARRDRLCLLLNEKPSSTYLSREECAAILGGAADFPELLVMEYLPGPEYSVDLLAKKGEPLVAVPRLREETRGGITFRGRVEHKPDLIKAAGEISRALSLEYNINLQFRYDSGGNPKLLEINPRVSGTIILCLGAGVNLPYLGVKLALGETPDIPTPRWGTAMTRYWEEVFYDPDGSPYFL
ncbi:hypothetical protein Huta_0481 [Calderihabitans maritimus]|uniref:ATP-grasp domain-containing protein n=2 Tax=Calderihabitans maritimus TaxID=1246530 RepID=A0A1Z5HX18_9FIRM|nr:hypothetical protein Huta_0481 [Calderihabitans maritimus]